MESSDVYPNPMVLDKLFIGPGGGILGLNIVGTQSLQGRQSGVRILAPELTELSTYQMSLVDTASCAGALHVSRDANWALIDTYVRVCPMGQ